MDVSVSVTIDQKPYLKKFRGDLAPPGSVYAVTTSRLLSAHLTAQQHCRQGCSQDFSKGG